MINTSSLNFPNMPSSLVPYLHLYTNSLIIYKVTRRIFNLCETSAVSNFGIHITMGLCLEMTILDGIAFVLGSTDEENASLSTGS